MKPEELIDIIGEIELKYVEEAQSAAPRRRKRKYWLASLAAAACFCIVITGMSFHYRMADKFSDSGAAGQKESMESASETDDMTNREEQSKKETRFVVKESEAMTDGVTQSGEICLLGEDFTAMTITELEAYYGALLIPENLPSDMELFADEGCMYGIYESDRRGVYYDENLLQFRNGQNGRELSMAVQTLSDDMIKDLKEGPIEISGFHYEDGEQGYSLNIVCGNILYYISSRGLTLEEVMAVAKEIDTQK